MKISDENIYKICELIIGTHKDLDHKFTNSEISNFLLMVWFSKETIESFVLYYKIPKAWLWNFLIQLQDSEWVVPGNNLIVTLIELTKIIQKYNHNFWEKLTEVLWYEIQEPIPDEYVIISWKKYFNSVIKKAQLYNLKSKWRNNTNKQRNNANEQEDSYKNYKESLMDALKHPPKNMVLEWLRTGQWKTSIVHNYLPEILKTWKLFKLTR
jgi:hypothetical protein